MNSKNRKYFLFQKIFNFFNDQDKSIFLLVHVNNMTILENNLILLYCSQNKIYNLNVKSNLYKKILRNKFFLNIFSGPTRIFAFKDFISFFSFFKNDYIKKIFIPLTIFWNNNFFIYSFFFKSIFFFFENNIKMFNENTFYISKFIFFTKNSIFNFLKILNIKFFLKKQKIYEEIFLNKWIIKFVAIV